MMSTVEAEHADRPFVLVIEDDRAMNHFVRRILSTAYRTEGVFDGKEGLARIVDSEPDLVVSDVMMPEMSGEQLVREVRARREMDAIPLLLLTAHSDEKIRIELLRAGANDFMMKPFSAAELLARARNLVNARLAERRSRRLQADLEERHRRLAELTHELTVANEELESFSYTVSHDLRAPLRAISGFTQALMEDHGERLDGTALHYLDRVHRATRRMSQLIDDLLQLARVGRAELARRPTSLSEIARKSWGELQHMDTAHVVEFHVDDGLVAHADARLMKVVLDNLLGNAWKFTALTAAPAVRFGAEKTADGPVYFVRDNGAGFDMTYAAKLFQPFQRLHSDAEFPGTGIGLATVRRVVDRHGGRVWAEGTVGGGATVFFTLAPSGGRA